MMHSEMTGVGDGDWKEEDFLTSKKTMFFAGRKELKQVIFANEIFSRLESFMTFEEAASSGVIVACLQSAVQGNLRKIATKTENMCYFMSARRGSFVVVHGKNRSRGLQY